MMISNFFSLYSATVKPWTILVYMAAAFNDLSDQALSVMQDMMRVGSNDNVNILVYLTIQKAGQAKTTKRLYIEKEKIQQIGPDIVRDSGDISALTDALQWACLDYPSDYMGVVLWGHGSGPLNRNQSMIKGMCYDYDSGHYLTDRDCLQAFSWVKDTVRDGKPFDIIACDACFLSSLEMAYTFSSCAHYFVGSEDAILKIGFQYSTLLSILTRQSCDPLSFARAMVDLYGRGYTGRSEYTLSVTDLNALELLVENVNAVAHILTSLLQGKNSVSAKVAIKKCISVGACLSFEEKHIYIDIAHFYKNLLKYFTNLKVSKRIQPLFKKLLMNGIDLLSKVVKETMASKNYKHTGGLSIYFGRHSIDSSYYGLYWTQKNPNWLKFLEAYLN